MQVDPNNYYGGEEASLTFDELINWAESVNKGKSSKFKLAKSTGKKPEQARQYSISLAPSLLPSKGPLITAVINSGVSRYGGFRLLESIAVYSGASFMSVPGSKEDIFRSKDISLIEKRHLMRFLTFAAGEFEISKELEGKAETPFVDFIKDVFNLNNVLADAIAYAIAFCSSRHGILISICFFITLILCRRDNIAIAKENAELHAVGRTLWSISISNCAFQIGRAHV